MNKIKIGAFDYKVIEKDDVNIDGVLKLGTFDYTNQTIEIKTGLTKDRKRQTLLHEIIHCIDDEYIVGLEEDQIERLTSGLLQVFRDNKGVI